MNEIISYLKDFSPPLVKIGQAVQIIDKLKMCPSK